MNDDAFDRRMMAFALRIAERGRTSPNPHVGAVIVRDGTVLATGYHHRAGQAHAEIDALQKLGGRAEGATLYVTLEPCNHHGRTGPCSEALLRAGVRRVVIGCDDRVHGHGGGGERLRAAGIEIARGVRGDEAEALVADFHKLTLSGVPYVTLKAAVTLDGRMATRSGDSRWITGERARKEAHRMRDRADAVMVGVGTVLADDPALTVRHVKGRDPVRVVLDSELSTPERAQVVSASAEAPLWIFHAPDVDESRRELLRQRGAELFEVERRERGLCLESVLRELGRRDIMRLLVEGGPTLHGALLDGGLVDRVALFMAPRLLNDAGGLPLSIGRAREGIHEAIALRDSTVRRLGADLLIEGAI
jgi:diaminohydroxyphosphoribosylaminopyrimidine deaminase/5-amino-6-(5-phosphoribosylamino)uracil reductase